MRKQLVSDRLFGGILFEFEGNVTQLGATSEVGTIGMKATVLKGERVRLLDYFVLFDDDASGRSGDGFILNASGVNFRNLYATTLDNEFVQSALGVAETTPAASEEGSVPEMWLGEGHNLNFRITSAAATKQLFFRFTYLAKHHPMVVAAIGSGITLTITKHEAI